VGSTPGHLVGPSHLSAPLNAQSTSDHSYSWTSLPPLNLPSIDTHWLPPCVNRRSYRNPALALAGGVVTGINPCAPVLLAFAAAAQSRALLEAITFFLWFFLGTAVYLLPLPLLGFLGRWDRLRLVARFAVGLMGAYYLYAGLLLVIR